MKGTRLALLAAALGIVAQQANAAGFALKEQSVTYLGNAFAGTASTAEDASTAYYNPAGLVELPNSQAVLAATYITAQNKLTTTTATKNSGAAVNGNNPTKPKSHGLVPGAFLAWKINNKAALGLSVSAPFGLSTFYNESASARYMATTSKISTVDISPVASYKINKLFSVGAGFDAMRVKATLASDLNFGAGEGYLINKGDDWSYGYHFGVIYKPSDLTKMGLAFFSKFKVNMNGTVEVLRYPFNPAPTTLSARITLPERFNYSVTHKYSDQWTAMGEVEWAHWSRLKVLRIDYNTGRNAQEYNYYRNTWRVSLGANYKYSDPLTLKGGIAFDQTPTSNEFRAARLPDADRYWLAFGMKYAINKRVSIGAAYAHLFIKDASIAQTATASGDQRRLIGNYKNSADIVGVQLTWNFV